MCSIRMAGSLDLSLHIHGYVEREIYIYIYTFMNIQERSRVIGTRVSLPDVYIDSPFSFIPSFFLFPISQIVKERVWAHIRLLPSPFSLLLLLLFVGVGAMGESDVL